MRLIKFRTVDQAVSAIAGEPGRIYTQLVWIESPLRLQKVANGDVARYSRAYPGKTTVERAARTMLKAGKTLGITKGAKAFLRSV